MEALILVLAVILLLPGYVFVLSAFAYFGKVWALRTLFRGTGEDNHGSAG